MVKLTVEEQEDLIRFYKTSEEYFQDLARKEEGYFEYYRSVITQFMQPGSLILDLGCGTGNSTRFLEKAGYRAIGTDISLKFLSRSSRTQGPEYVVCDITQACFKDEIFDLVGSYDVVEHIYDIEAALDSMVRITKKGGLVLIATPDNLSPFRSLVRAILFKKKPVPAGTKLPPTVGGRSRLSVLLLFFKHTWFLVQKKLSRRPIWHFRKPLLDNPWGLIGGDYDAVYLSNMVDLTKYFLSQGLLILYQESIKLRNQQTFWRRHIGTLLFKIFPNFMGSGLICIVAQKQGASLSTIRYPEGAIVKRTILDA